jgi:hypothetical protein
MTEASSAAAAQSPRDKSNTAAAGNLEGNSPPAASSIHVQSDGLVFTFTLPLERGLMFPAVGACDGQPAHQTPRLTSIPRGAAAYRNPTRRLELSAIPQRPPANASDEEKEHDLRALLSALPILQHVKWIARPAGPRGEHSAVLQLHDTSDPFSVLRSCRTPTERRGWRLDLWCRAEAEWLNRHARSDGEYICTRGIAATNCALLLRCRSLKDCPLNHSLDNVRQLLERDEHDRARSLVGSNTKVSEKADAEGGLHAAPIAHGPVKGRQHFHSAASKFTLMDEEKDEDTEEVVSAACSSVRVFPTGLQFLWSHALHPGLVVKNSATASDGAAAANSIAAAPSMGELIPIEDAHLNLWMRRVELQGLPHRPQAERAADDLHWILRQLHLTGAEVEWIARPTMDPSADASGLAANTSTVFLQLRSAMDSIRVLGGVKRLLAQRTARGEGEWSAALWTSAELNRLRFFARSGAEHICWHIHPQREGELFSLRCDWTNCRWSHSIQHVKAMLRRAREATPEQVEAMQRYGLRSPAATASATASANLSAADSGGSSDSRRSPVTAAYRTRSPLQEAGVARSPHSDRRSSDRHSQRNNRERERSAERERSYTSRREVGGGYDDRSPSTSHRESREHSESCHRSSSRRSSSRSHAERRRSRSRSRSRSRDRQRRDHYRNRRDRHSEPPVRSTADRPHEDPRRRHSDGQTPRHSPSTMHTHHSSTHTADHSAASSSSTARRASSIFNFQQQTATPVSASPLAHLFECAWSVGSVWFVDAPNELSHSFDILTNDRATLQRRFVWSHQAPLVPLTSAASELMDFQKAARELVQSSAVKGGAQIEWMARVREDSGPNFGPPRLLVQLTASAPPPSSSKLQFADEMFGVRLQPWLEVEVTELDELRTAILHSGLSLRDEEQVSAVSLCRSFFAHAADDDQSCTVKEGHASCPCSHDVAAIRRLQDARAIRSSAGYPRGAVLVNSHSGDGGANANVPPSVIGVVVAEPTATVPLDGDLLHAHALQVDAPCSCPLNDSGAEELTADARWSDAAEWVQSLYSLGALQTDTPLAFVRRLGAKDERRLQLCFLSRAAKELAERRIQQALDEEGADADADDDQHDDNPDPVRGAGGDDVMVAAQN